MIYMLLYRDKMGFEIEIQFFFFFFLKLVSYVAHISVYMYFNQLN